MVGCQPGLSGSKGLVAWWCEHSSELSGSIKCGELYCRINMSALNICYLMRWNYVQDECHIQAVTVVTNVSRQTHPTLVDLQLDAQNSYLFIYNTFIKILYMFRTLPWSSSGGLRRNCIYAASGIVTICRWLSCVPVKKLLSSSVHKRVTCRKWRYQRLHIYNYDVDLLKMSRVMLETCRGF